jgi:glycosyltransferase involved in cell wall biosynthesis
VSDTSPLENLVSVIIPVRNSERYLAQALDSVIAQTYPHFEIIIVDAHSTDTTSTIAQSYPRVRFIQQANQGLADAWNTGIDSARGDWICFLDSDDRWPPDKIKLQMDYLCNNPGLECVIAHVRFFLQANEKMPSSFNPTLLEREHVAYMPGALMSRRTVFERIGKFGTEWQIAPDIDWFAKLKDAHVPLGILTNVLLFKRVHENNLSYVTAETPLINQEVLRLLRQSIGRQRANSKRGDASND